jgi:hypothetical protein
MGTGSVMCAMGKKMFVHFILHWLFIFISGSQNIRVQPKKKIKLVTKLSRPPIKMLR